MGFFFLLYGKRTVGFPQRQVGKLFFTYGIFFLLYGKRTVGFPQRQVGKLFFTYGILFFTLWETDRRFSAAAGSRMRATYAGVAPWDIVVDLWDIDVD
jgi:hypothetical protein